MAVERKSSSSSSRSSRSSTSGSSSSSTEGRSGSSSSEESADDGGVDSLLRSLEALVSEDAEKERLRSFDAWPHAELENLSPISMARAGFEHDPLAASKKPKKKARADRVRCVHCHSLLHGWEETDDPLDEHLREEPTCDLALFLNRRRNDVASKVARPDKKLLGDWDYDHRASSPSVKKALSRQEIGDLLTDDEIAMWHPQKPFPMKVPRHVKQALREEGITKAQATKNPAIRQTIHDVLADIRVASATQALESARENKKRRPERDSEMAKSTPFLGTPTTPRLAKRLQDPDFIKKELASLATEDPEKLDEKIRALKQEAEAGGDETGEEEARPVEDPSHHKKGMFKAATMSSILHKPHMPRKKAKREKKEKKGKKNGSKALPASQPAPSYSVRSAGGVLMEQVRCHAIREFVASDGAELNLSKGDVVFLLHPPNAKRQWKGQSEGGEVGFFDADCVEVEENENADSELDDDMLFADLVDAVTPSSPPPEKKNPVEIEVADAVKPLDQGEKELDLTSPNEPPGPSVPSSDMSAQSPQQEGVEPSTPPPSGIPSPAESEAQVTIPDTSYPEPETRVRVRLAEQVAICESLRKQVARLVEASTQKDQTIDELRQRIAELEDEKPA